MEKTRTAPGTSLVAIFGRLLGRAKEPLDPRLAEYLLSLGFEEEDQARMHDLAVRNQDGALSATEKEELNNYVQAGYLLGLMHSKARIALQKSKKSLRA